MASKNKQKEPCMCECHNDDSGYLFEFYPCCHFSNKKYINIKGEIEESRFPKLNHPRKPRKKK